jgi:catechol 2,3-dioxygenase-like lactoylglutathione lyase family enzyme
LINGAHVTVFAHDADAARAFFRDVLDLPCVDVGGGWLTSRCRRPRSPSTPERVGEPARAITCCS